MKKFKFKLQRLLDLREAREKEVKNELAKILGLQNLEREKQMKLKAGIEENKELFHDKFAKKKYDVNELLMFEKYVDVSLRAIDAAQNRIDELEPEAQKIREKLVEVSRDRKVVEKLKERQKNEYDIELNREINRENDDLNQKLYFQRKMSEQQ